VFAWIGPAAGDDLRVPAAGSPRRRFGCGSRGWGWRPKCPVMCRCSRRWRPAGRTRWTCGCREEHVTSCDVHVLVHQAAKQVVSQGPDGRGGGRGSAAGRRMLIKRSVRVVRVVMLDVVVQHCCEVASSADQEVVEAFPAQHADERSAMALARSAWTGVRRIAMSAPTKTASKAARDLASRRGSSSGTGQRGRRGRVQWPDTTA
jgi:hypothetical protein